jgi:hypothetical protein
MVLLALAVCMLFSVVFAEAAIANDFDHDCTGEGCPFCLAIETAHNFLKSLRLGGAVAFLAVGPAFSIQTPPKCTDFSLSFNSPVVLKVRFNS